jgi:ketosteroid isomerase-like protein
MYDGIMRGDTPDAARLFTPDVIQEEFPNRFVPNGIRRDLQGILEAARRGKGVMAGQTLEILNAVASGNTVVVEAGWSGTLAVPVGQLAAGSVMRARFAQFYEFRDGRIARMRNYDCFEPG